MTEIGPKPEKRQEWLRLQANLQYTPQREISLMFVLNGSKKDDEESQKVLKFGIKTPEYAALCRGGIPSQGPLGCRAVVHEEGENLRLELSTGHSQGKMRIVGNILAEKDTPIFDSLTQLKNHKPFLPNRIRLNKQKGSKGEMLPAANVPAIETKPYSGYVKIVQGGAPDSNRRTH